MIFNKEDQEFLEKLAPTRTGKSLLKVLENIETFYADIRNVGDVKPEVRIDALKFYREALVDRLITMQNKKSVGEDNREWE
jgi:hypothetical protein